MIMPPERNEGANNPSSLLKSLRIEEIRASPITIRATSEKLNPKNLETPTSQLSVATE